MGSSDNNAKGGSKGSSRSGSSRGKGSPSSSSKDRDEAPDDGKKSRRIERMPIDRSFEVESARRGLETRPWSLRLMSASTALLGASVVFSLASVFFAYRQAPAEIYVSTVDGGLFLAPSVIHPENLHIRFDELNAEATSLKKAGVPAQQAQQKPALPLPAAQSTGPTTEAPASADPDAVGPSTLGGPSPAGAAAPGGPSLAPSVAGPQQ